MLMQHNERHGLACDSFSAALNFLSTFRGFTRRDPKTDPASGCSFPEIPRADIQMQINFCGLETSEALRGLVFGLLYSRCESIRLSFADDSSTSDGILRSGVMRSDVFRLMSQLGFVLFSIIGKNAGF